jgi:hypothetical protein
LILRRNCIGCSLGRGTDDKKAGAVMSISVSAMTRGLAFASAVFGGALVGTVIQRVVIDLPAWRQLGAQAWADYSRHADLGTGVIAYPIEAGGWMLVALAMALSHRLDRRASRLSAAPIYLTAGLTIGVLAITAKAAPIMFRIRGLGDDSTALRDAFDQFTFWGLQVRGAVVGAAFLTSLWALAATFAEQRTGLAASPTGLLVNRR